MHVLNMSQDEMNMADNYFTLLHNKFPEVWLDQGIELGGGQPFTTGTEGHERNMLHIVRHMYLPCLSKFVRFCSILIGQSYGVSSDDD